MLTTVDAVCFSILIITLLIVIKFLRKEYIPKGLKDLPKTSGWPLFGTMFSFKGPLFSYLYQLKIKHGPIFKVTMGCRDLVVISTSKMMTRTLKEMGKTFSGRWKDISVLFSLHDTGLLFQDSEWWEVQRSFVLRVLRDFGLGKQKSQEIVHHECSYLLKEIEKNCDQVMSTGFLFPKYMVNVIAKLVMNRRFERSDTNFQSLTKLVESLSHNESFAEMFLIMYPILERMPRLSNFLLWICGRNKQFDEMHGYIKDIIAAHEKRFNISNEGEDLIDMFLKQKHQLDANNTKDHTFTEWQLISVTLELFAAGYETTSTTLSWSMLFLARHPEVQERAYQEIVNVIGLVRKPNALDKKDLIYVQAVMDEIFRLSSVVPLSIPHRALESTDIDGYFIPKNSVIIPNIYAAHHDQDSWKQPFKFYPKHFLTKVNGIEKYAPREELMPFGTGKRQCLGESLARLEFFIFLTSILQRFKVKFPREIDDNEYNEITVGTDGLIRAPLYTDVIFELREI